MPSQQDEWTTAIDPQPFRCPHCGAVLGASLDNALIIGAVRIHEPLRMECGGCRQRFTWEPVPDGIDQAPKKG